jgi:hypothetical protein
MPPALSITAVTPHPGPSLRLSTSRNSIPIENYNLCHPVFEIWMMSPHPPSRLVSPRCCTAPFP